MILTDDQVAYIRDALQASLHAGSLVRDFSDPSERQAVCLAVVRAASMAERALMELEPKTAGGCCVGCSGDSGQPCTWYGECESD